MVKKIGGEIKFKRSRDGCPTPVGDNIFDLLRKMGGSPERARLVSLWEGWAEAMGEEYAWISPKGHKGSVLLVWADDSMEMQEISMLAPRVLERANAWLKSEFFSSLRIAIRAEKSGKVRK